MKLTDIIEAATPGPWEYAGKRPEGFGHLVTKGGYAFVSVFWRTGETTASPPSTSDESDARYIATFDPTLTAALVRVAKGAEFALSMHDDTWCGQEYVAQLEADVEALADILKERGLE